MLRIQNKRVRSIDKDTVDEFIFKTRNHLMLELMARGRGTRVGEALELTPTDVNERKAVGVSAEAHELRRQRGHSCFQIRSAGRDREQGDSPPQNLSTTQRYLGKVTDTEAIRWIDNLYS